MSTTRLVDSQKLYLSLHRFLGTTSPKSDQAVNQSPDGATSWMCINDPRMGRLLVGKPQEIVVVRDDHSILRGRKGEMLAVRRADQARVAGCGDVDAAKAQPIGHGAIDVLIEMEANCHRRSFLSLTRSQRRVPLAAPLHNRRNP